jgi:hypothetical protein
MILRKQFFLSTIILFVLLSFPMVGSVGASMLWSQTYGGDQNDRGTSLVATSDGGYILAGSTREPDSYQNSDVKADFLLIKTDSLGNMEWNQKYGGTNSDSVSSIVENSDGGYTFAGSTLSFGAGDSDFWLVKTDAYNNIPEFPSLTILALLFVGTLLAVISKKRLRS